MTNIVMLDNVAHANLKVRADHSAAFGDNVNLAPVFPSEFGDVQREYPILFRKDSNGDFQAVALLGLDKDENLFLDEHGWRARYIPAIQQRGPFMIGFRQVEDRGEIVREPMIHIDLDHPRVSQVDGEPLFLAHGGNAPYLEHVSRALRVIRDGIEVSKPMFDAFEAAGLIEPVSIEISLSERVRYDLSEFYMIGRDTLQRLDGAQLEALNRAGVLGLAFLVVSSLGNVNRLIELKTRKRAAG